MFHANGEENRERDKSDGDDTENFLFQYLETSRSRLEKINYFELQTDSDCLRRRIVISHLRGHIFAAVGSRGATMQNERIGHREYYYNFRSYHSRISERACFQCYLSCRKWQTTRKTVALGEKKKWVNKNKINSKANSAPESFRLSSFSEIINSWMANLPDSYVFRKSILTRERHKQENVIR